MNSLRWLVWIYGFLLIFEGAARKWGPPALSAPLLLIRDPVVVLIFFQAMRFNLKFSNFYFIANLFLAVTTIITATLFGIANPLVTIYGVLANYLMIPLIFLMPQIIHKDDVLRMGQWLLYLAVPMALLVVLQYRSSPDSFWNKGAMATHYGTVRPSGTFSFGNGLTYFYSFVASFLFYGYLQVRTYKLWLLVVATFFTLVTCGFSGSRSCIVSIGIVLAAAVFCVVIRGKGGLGLIVAGGLIAVAVGLLSTSSVATEATQQLQERFKDAGQYEGGAGGFVGRYFGTFLSAFEIMGYVDFFGYGLGTGTNGGAVLFAASADLPWPENEWARLVFECGPLFGLLICAYRTALTWHVGLKSYRALRHGNILPILIFAAVGLLILNGQWGGPTPLGFAIFGAGLTLAACQEPEEEWQDDEEQGEHMDDHVQGETHPAHEV